MRRPSDDRSALVRDLKKLVALPSVSADSNLRVARAAAELMKAAGFRVIFQNERLEGRNYANVVGVKGRGKKPLLLCAHLDTVPAGDLAKWTKTGKNPWKATVRGAKVHGLGTADDKGSLVSMIRAGGYFKSSELRRPLIVLATFGEESGMGGARAFVRKWKQKPALAFVGEPTALTVTYRHKGMGVIEVEWVSRLRGAALKGARTHVFKGKQGHSSRPWLGDNALDKAARFLKKLPARAMLASLKGGFAANLIPDRAEVTLAAAGRGGVPVFPAHAIAHTFYSVQSVIGSLKERDKSFRPASITSNFGIARVRGNRLTMTFDFRLLPGQDVHKILKKLKSRMSGTAWKGLSWRARIERENPPLGLGKKNRAATAAQWLLQHIGIDPVLVTKPSCTEAGVYANWGVPCVVVGPGESAGNIHAPNESIPIRQMEDAVRFYCAAIQELCVQNRSF